MFEKAIWLYQNPVLDWNGSNEAVLPCAVWNGLAIKAKREAQAMTTPTMTTSAGTPVSDVHNPITAGECRLALL
ncbi:hypothetical protein ACFFTN_10405 [Aminobacter aganoensis]|uniref:Uncharacterized protein n=1 Tax=Aminobacter aganoensis TaxID=83264 RepID=A0A7X0FCG7_9HYPH|nr:hypothetical protein [Aminobacter aganoensis]MBB6357183.1 hypothetical protein [Aminobacter aganoensis]